MEKIMSKKVLFILKVVLPLVIAILSFTLLSKAASSRELHTATVETLQVKQDNILKLTASSTAIAAGASLLLGDRATAVSSKLLDLTGYFIIILCAILLEKYLVTTMGLVSFKILMPVACILFSLFTIVDRENIRKLSLKLAVFSIIAFLIIPTSVVISNVIDDTYQMNLIETIENSESIQNEIETESITSEIESATTESENSIDDTQSEDRNVVDSIGKFFGDTKDNVVNFATGIKDNAANIVENAKNSVIGAVSVVTERAKELVDKMTRQLNNMIEAIAVMLVTTCVIPILVVLFFIWVVKMIFSVDIKISKKDIPRLSEMR